MNIPLCFSVTFYNEITNFFDFFVASQHEETLPKWSQLIKKRICSLGSKFFPLRVDSIEKVGQNVKERDVSPGSVY